MEPKQWIFMAGVAIFVAGCGPSSVGPAQWAGKTVILSGEYEAVMMGKDTSVALYDTSSVKILNYFGPQECSPCRLQDLIRWQALLSDLQPDSLQRSIRFINIFGVNRDVGIMKINSMTYRIDYPIFIDTIGAFERANPHLPSDPVFHTFLLDRDNRVVLVGSPIGNPKMWELYKSTIARLVENGGILPKRDTYNTDLNMFAEI